ncbi:class I SAM-dependent methyltransferase [Paenibacillus hamazuiensis]|uniref:class I SAM-dependent methyltransferase n=1 Tax=Paenibacillus hamazuiensis TaxID=2936508 RepID=UPI00200D4214|nr:class I SAM-dependent methyltransferase [Paenibacillus hamazuiensis]
MVKQNEPDHSQIYAEEAERYDLLVAREMREEVFRAMDEIADWRGKVVVELGAGTGSLSVRIGASARSLTLLDASPHMLELAGRRLAEAGIRHARYAEADHLALPLDSASADIVLAGWTLCYAASSDKPEWQARLRRAMGEIRRVLRPGGTAVIIETLGTGNETPQPPSFLQPYYRELERTYGFRHRWVRAGFKFASAEEAERLVRFFFGSELADRVKAERLTAVPGCAGIWWRQMTP